MVNLCLQSMNMFINFSFRQSFLIKKNSCQIIIIFEPEISLNAHIFILLILIKLDSCIVYDFKD